MRFIDNKNGTITDTTTGLIWQKEAPEETMTWEKAQEYCRNLDLDGKTDWRSPTITELKTIVGYSRYNPATNTTYFPNSVPSFYWSSTTLAYNTSLAWGVYFYYGFDDNFNKTNSHYVRAVRGGQSVALDNLVIDQKIR